MKGELLASLKDGFSNTILTQAKVKTKYNNDLKIMCFGLWIALLSTN
jgi:hypothetical protein